MKKRKESDASLWIGLVLGATLGAAATVILAAASEPDTNFPRLNLRPQKTDTNTTKGSRRNKMIHSGPTWAFATHSRHPKSVKLLRREP